MPPSQNENHLGNKCNNVNTNNNNDKTNHSKRKSHVKRHSIPQPQTNTNRRAAGSNWLLNVQQEQQAQKVNEPKMDEESENLVENCKLAMTTNGGSASSPEALSKSARHRQKRKEKANRYVALDCEMVGIGPNGQDDMLARVSIVNRNGVVLLDKHVKPREIVTDYRTSVSGIRPNDIENAEEFDYVQEEVVQLLYGKILVGHAVRNDLRVLLIKHPFVNIRDTSRYKPLAKLVSNGRTPSLKRLALAVLGKEIQTGEHNSVEDARATMSIYNKVAVEWEQYIDRHHRK